MWPCWLWPSRLPAPRICKSRLSLIHICVLGGVISALTSFAAPGDAVLLHSPTYIGFTASVENNG